jgi:hypothetical protein
MNDDSVLVWAKLKNELPELVTFSICTWVKFTYEVRLHTFNQSPIIKVLRWAIFIKQNLRFVLVLAQHEKNHVKLEDL